jgi:antitoxin MazE
MKTRIVNIGNSCGVRLPKVLLEQSGLGEEVELEVRGNSIAILPARRPRAGWAEAAQQLHDENGDLLLDGDMPTEFDEREWSW